MLSVRPRVRVAPRADYSDGPDASFLTSGYGLTPDPWQDDVLDDWLGRTRDGKYTAGQCGLVVGRQNGKNAVLEVREVFGMVALGEKFLHSAHEVKTARKAFKRLKHFFGERADDPGANFPELNALVREVRNTNGQEAIILANGGSVEVVARSKGSGRGFTVDVLVLDEAQDLSDDEMEAMLSTVSSAPLRNPQVIFTGTPPNPDKGQTGDVFRRLRSNVGQSKRLAWTDFGVEDGPLPDINDRDLLHATNPSLGTRLMTSVIDDERELLSAEGFARERFGWWGNPLHAGVQIFGEGSWSNLAVTKIPTQPLAIGIAVSIDRAWSSIGAVMESGKPHLGSLKRVRGVEWVVTEAKRIRDQYGIPIAIAGRGPAASLIDALTEAGVEPIVAGIDDYQDACAELFDRVAAGTVEHGNYDDLNEAVAGAKWTAGERRVWTRKSGDVSMLEAVTLALWVSEQETESIYETRGLVTL